MGLTDKRTVLSYGPERAERIKILFQYGFMLLGGFFIGALLPSFFSQDTQMKLADTVAQHFSLPFANCQGWLHRLSLVSYASAMDWILIGISFLFSFSVLNYLISDIVLSYIGFRFGLCISILCRLIGAECNSFVFHRSHLLSFGVFKLLIVVCLFLYSYRLTSYSYEIKQTFRNGRASIRLEHLIPLLGLTLICGILIFLIHVLYGWIIFHISK